MEQRVYALQYSDHCQAVFLVNGEDEVRVTALIGAASYIDRDMTRAAARREWRKLTDAGWFRVPGRSVDVRNLRMRIYD